MLEIQQEILDFWFLPEDHVDHGQVRPEWFKKDAQFDQEIQDKFLAYFENAVNGDYLNWTETGKGCMALILLFDQFSRNMFRDDPKAFSADGKAIEIARHMITQGFFDALPTIHKKFAALPFEHSENLGDQIHSLEVFTAFGDNADIDYAKRHLEIIEKFGRFPHRNAVLNRPSTEEELEFLGTPGSSF